MRGSGTLPSQSAKKYTAAGLQNQQSSIYGIHKGQSAILHSMHICFDVVVCGQQCMKSTTQLTSHYGNLAAVWQRAES